MYTATRLHLKVLRLLQISALGLCAAAGEAWAATGITVTLSDALGTDLNADGRLNPGDSIVYTARVMNSGEMAANGLVFTAAPDPLTSLVPGSVRTASGQVTDGNTPSSTAVRVALDSLPAGQSATLMFEAQLAANAARPSSGVVRATAAVMDLATIVPSDDPDTPAANDPTATEVFVPTPPDLGPPANSSFSGGGFSFGCAVGRGQGQAAPAPLLLSAAALLMLLRRRAAPRRATLSVPSMKPQGDRLVSAQQP